MLGLMPVNPGVQYQSTFIDLLQMLEKMNNLYTPYIDLILCIQYIFLRGLAKNNTRKQRFDPQLFWNTKTASLEPGSHFCNFWAMPQRSQINQLFASWWLSHPFEKYACQIRNLPQLEVKIKKYLKPPPGLGMDDHPPKQKKECRIPEKRIRNGIWMDMLWVMPWNGHLFFPGGYLCFKGVVSLILQTPIFSKRCSDSRRPRLTHSGKWGYWGFQDKICMSSSNKYSV